MSRPKKLLVLQFRYDESRTAVENLDFRHELEDALDGALRRNRSGEVDGGDIGSGTINIWIYLTAWSHGLPVVEAYLKHRKLLEKTVIAKKINNTDWEVVRPKDFQGSFSLLGTPSV